MRVKIKKLDENAIIPQCETPFSAGMDLYATSKFFSEQYTEYGTGIAIELPYGYVGLLFPRSSISAMSGMSLANSVGVVDADFRGEIKLRFRGGDYAIGDRVAQLVVVPHMHITFEETETLTDTVRGSGGFGSTGE